jgi:hypothetical protein
VPAWIPYTALRLGVFAAALALLLVLQVTWWIAAVAAAVIGFCVSYLFFPALRGRVALELHAARTARENREPAAPGTDEDVEDRR